MRKNSLHAFFHNNESSLNSKNVKKMVYINGKIRLLVLIMMSLVL